jgi:hypothetical protein
VSDELAILEAHAEKLEKRAERLRAQATSAETELEEVRTAIRVLERLRTPAGEAAAPTGRVRQEVITHLPPNPTSAKTPHEIWQALSDVGVSTSQANVRTILSRLVESGTAAKTDGKYWRAPVDIAPNQHPDDPGPQFDDMDDTDDVPF